MANVLSDLALDNALIDNVFQPDMLICYVDERFMKS
jgi:hypothetical protein